MTWDSFHRRGEVLRRVLEHAENRRDGALPMHLPGVAETFGDEITLLGTLQLRWHTRLAGAVERELMGPAGDLEEAVTRGWRAAAADLAGVRAILDAQTAAPSSADIARMLDKGHRKDWTLLAAMAGKAAPGDDRAAEVGRRIERRARDAYRPQARPGGRGRHVAPSGRTSLVSRFRSHLVA